MEPMQIERFLGLLNKTDRTPEEEADLQAELKRQEEEKAKTQAPDATPQDAQPATDAPAEDPAVEPVAEEQAEPVAEQPAPADKEPVEVQEENVPYTLEKLDEELQDAIAFIGTHNATLAVEQAKAELKSASYWIKLAIEGK